MDCYTLKNGVKIPAIGLGTYPLMGDTLTRALVDAYNIGYRMVDTADNYYNEEDLGKSLSYLYSHNSATRQEMFLVSKVSDDLYPQGSIDAGNNMGKFFWKNSPYMAGENAVKNVMAQKLESSLKYLQTDYLDLWLMHWPYPDFFEEIWYEMEQAYKQGKVRAIGLCNSRERHFEKLKGHCSVFPHVNQVETSPINSKASLMDYCNANDVRCMVYSPLKNLSLPYSPAYKQFVKALAEKYGKTKEQIVLRFHIQRGSIPIPKSSHAERLKGNYDVFDFSISEEDMKALLTFNCDYQYMAESMRCPGL